MDRSGTSPPSGINDYLLRGSVSSSGARSMDVIVYFVNDNAIPLTVDGISTTTAQELHRKLVEVLHLPDIALEVFALWLISPFLEVQLKPRHHPYKVCRQWHDLLGRFTNCTLEDIQLDEPSLQLRRNIYFPKSKELQITDGGILRLLYEEAKYNVLEGRYPCDVEDCELLGGLSCCLELGPYIQEKHTPSTLRPQLDSFLPSYLCKKKMGILNAFRNRGNRQVSFEETLVNTYKAAAENVCPEDGDVINCKEYLKKCHELPYYGCAFFQGEVDKPAQGFLNRNGRKTVSVAINMEGVSVIDRKEKHVLLSLKFFELSWDHTYPDEEEHILWLEFDGDNEGTPVNKLLKIYSKQAELMSGLIEYCIELSQGNDLPSPETIPGISHDSGKRTNLRRQESVVCNRIKNLTTIDYVDDGTEIKRVKPKRSASFFNRQSTHSYASVQPSETPGQS
ncbi:FERM domain-containing protein 8 isoform X1 [Ranitomeya imitator]|uniref:FERM domain-containing protein 8 isoform X1 n=1 Tax=Ranitomeya imitator TaxID=111125 RepID=UPI0037E87D75